MAPQEPTRKRSGFGSGREIPDKLYFRIGEVAKLCEVPAYVLRFWEGEFPQLRPNKGGTGQRLFRRRDVEMALRIKTLLYDEGYTIPGARQAFKAELRGSKDVQLGLGGVADTIDAKHLLALQKELRELHALLSRPATEKQSIQPIRPPRPAPTDLKPARPPLLKPTLLHTSKPAAASRSDSLFDFPDLPSDPPSSG